jgi:hypothetical protein
MSFDVIGEPLASRVFKLPDRCAFVSALPAGRARLLDTPMHAVEGGSSETTIHPEFFDGFRSIFCDERAGSRWQPDWIAGNDLRHTANFAGSGRTGFE